MAHVKTFSQVAQSQDHASMIMKPTLYQGKADERSAPNLPLKSLRYCTTNLLHDVHFANL